MKTLLKKSKRGSVVESTQVPTPLNKARWKQKLRFPEPDKRGASVYVRPYRCDEQTIRELAEYTGETYNTIATKLIHVALRNKKLTTDVFERHHESIQKIEEYFEGIFWAQDAAAKQLIAIEKQQERTHRFVTALLSEIFCLLHIAVSLLRMLFVAVLGQVPERLTPIMEKTLVDFDDVDDRVIKKSFYDLKQTFGFYKMGSEKINPHQLFLRSKLSEPNWIKRRAEHSAEDQPEFEQADDQADDQKHSRKHEQQFAEENEEETESAKSINRKRVKKAHLLRLIEQMKTIELNDVDDEYDEDEYDQDEDEYDQDEDEYDDQENVDENDADDNADDDAEDFEVEANGRS